MTSRPDMDRIQADIADLREQMTAFTEALRHDAEATGSEAWQRVRAAGQATRERAGEAGRYVRNQAEHATEATRGQITQHPLTSVGTAFALGIVLGALLGRR